MNVIIKPGKVSGTIKVPASKSHTHRSLIIASLAKGISRLRNILISDDTLITLNVLEQLGINIKRHGQNIWIKGNGGFFNLRGRNTLFLGNSGTSLRLLTSVACLAVQNGGEVIIDANERLRERPIADLVSSLKTIGANISFMKKRNCLPIFLKPAPLSAGLISVRGSSSSQFLSSLLLIAPLLRNETTIKVIDKLKSAPYVGITTDLMKHFGVSVKNKDFEKFLITKNQQYVAREYTVEGDYSSACYFFAAAAICKTKVRVSGLNPYSIQADKEFLRILGQMGCQVKKKLTGFTVIGASDLEGGVFDLSNSPDIVPTLAIVAAFAKGKTVIQNIQHLRVKETDRIKALETELKKCGIKVTSTINSLTIIGGEPKGSIVNTYNDHRIAMGFTILGLGAFGETVIKDSQVVSKSYPEFFADLRKLKCQFREKI